MKKVVRIIARLNVGGPAIHTIILSSGLNKERFSTTLICGAEGENEGSMRQEAKKRGINLIFLPELGRELHPIKDIITLIKLFWIIKKIQPDIVHTHTAKAGAIGRLAAWLAGVPVIIHTFHGHVLHSYFSPVKTKLFIWIEKFLGRITDRIIVLTESQRKEILGFGIGKENRFFVIPLGLELDKFYNIEGKRGILRKELGLSSETPLIGIVARLVPIKDHRTFVFAAKLLLEKIPEAKFIVVGDGPERANIERFVEELKIQDAVFFPGFREDLDIIYADLSLLVLSSLNEGLPVAIIEAQASGKPVVSTNVGGVPELIKDGETGYLVPVKNPEMLAEAMEKILKSPDSAKRMGEAGKESSKKYRAERLMQDIENLYLYPKISPCQKG
ncbi:GT4 family glycosyltransferase PelF [bacterium]|nr:GT4 family glycosyltransferase PelF [bacterium]MBU1599025.1 GT4 family glycosyltransferase PelF [bacterium]